MSRRDGFAAMVSRRATVEPEQIRHAVPVGRTSPRRGRSTVNAICGAQVARVVSRAPFDLAAARACPGCVKRLEAGRSGR